jgi:hypothetical protein
MRCRRPVMANLAVASRRLAVAAHRRALRAAAAREVLAEHGFRPGPGGVTGARVALERARAFAPAERARRKAHALAWADQA